MARPYRTEMAELRRTMEWASETDISRLSSAVSDGWSSPLVAVGSGGSFSAASHLARLHRVYFQQVAAAATPFRLMSEPIAPAAAHWIFSASGSNVDVVAALQASELGEPLAVNVVTLRAQSKVADICQRNPFLRLHILDTPSKKDGFLATNSLLAFCALFSRCYLDLVGRGDEWKKMRDTLGNLTDSRSVQATRWHEEAKKIGSVEHLIVLHGGDTNLGGVDIESKLVEAGIKNVQLADYRHFAHGRHHWLAKNANNTGVLAFLSQTDHRLAQRTLELIPSEIPIAQIHVEGAGESAELASLFAAFHLTEQAGFAIGIDPGQPGVPDFGRKVYGLRIPLRNLPDSAEIAVGRKLRVQGRGALGQFSVWRRNFDLAIERLSSTALKGVVLDYDGTIVDTPKRFEPPEREICAELLRLLDGGIQVAVATGRGRSAGESLRAALPSSVWPQILVGYYNGSSLLALDNVDGPSREGLPTEAITDFNDLIQEMADFLPRMQIDLRPHQLTITPSCSADADTLWTELRELIDEHRLSGVRLMRSSHSVDAVDSSATKLNVVSAIIGSGGVLRIGDRGRWPGNDFQLLADPLGISVDEVSGHPYNCWNLAPPGLRGMRATLRYLSSIALGDAAYLKLKTQ